MRIAIYHDLPSGGAKRTLHDTVQRLGPNHHVDVYTLSCANHDFADLRPHVARYEIYPFRPLPLFSSPFGRLNQLIRLTDLSRLRLVTRRIASAIEQGQYDLAYVQPCQFENSPSILGFLTNVASVYYCHEPLRVLYEKMPDRPYSHHASPRRQALDKLDPLPALYYRFLRRTDQHNIHRAGQVLVNSVFTQDAVRQTYGLEAGVSYHGTDAQFFRPLNIEKRNMLLSVGSLTPLKGFDFVIRAVSHITTDLRPSLVVASNFQNPPERDYLQGLAGNLGVRLEMVCNIPDERLVELYNQAKITVYAPLREPFGLVPLESMACGTPVVSVDEGGMRETVVHGYSGLLTERVTEKFADAVQGLLANPELASVYGQNGRERVLASWTWDRAVSTLESFFHVSMTRKTVDLAPAFER